MKTADTETIMVPLADIRPCPTNPRDAAEDDALRELAESVKTVGVLQPLLLRPAPRTWILQEGRENARNGWFLLDQRLFLKNQAYNGVPRFFAKRKDADKALEAMDKGYEVIFGHRRFAAAKLAGLKLVPAVVRDWDDRKVAEVQLIENRQREDLKPSQESAAFNRMVREYQYTAERLAEVVKLSVAQVRGILLLARCPEELLKAVDAGRVGRTVAELVCRIPEADARLTASWCVLSGSPKPVGKPVTTDANPLGFRQTRELITTHFQRELKGATFKLNLKTLLPEAGACTDCPKRSGNAKKEDPEAFAGTRDDICLDPGCFRAKAKAQERIDAEKAKEAEPAPAPKAEANGKPRKEPATANGRPSLDEWRESSRDVAEKPGRKQFFRVTSVDCKAVGLVLQMNSPCTFEDIQETFYRNAREFLTFDFEEVDGPNGKPISEPAEAAA